jgi:DNA-binding response OmpR family regulator
VRGALVALLDGAGVRAAAAGPHEAPTAARRERPALALLDVLMPGLDGPSLCRRLREHYGRDLPVIFISTVPEYAVASMAVGWAPWIYLPRPCSSDALLAAIRRQLSAA